MNNKSTTNNNSEELTTGKIWVSIFLIILIVGGYIGADELVQWRKRKASREVENKIAEKIDNNIKVTTPKQENPTASTVKEVDDEYTGTGGITTEPKILPLIKEEYIPSAEVYNDPEKYKEKVPRIGLVGEFEVASLHIKGKIDNNLANFTSVNIGTISGTYGLERSGADELDLLRVNLDEYPNSVIIKKEPGEFLVIVDLVVPQKISTTRNEFLATGKKYKNIVLWDEIKPRPDMGNASITRLYSLIYDENGVYGNETKITELNFVYTCIDGDDEKCGAAVCGPEYDPGSACLAEKFGAEAAQKYIKYHQNNIL